MLGCTLRPTKLHLPVSSTCSSKEESRVGDREINGLPDGGAYVSEAGSGRDAPTVCSRLQDRTWWQAWLLGAGKVTSDGGTQVRLAHQLPGGPAEGHAPHCPFDGQAHRKVSQVSRAQVKQELVQEGCTETAILNSLTPRAPRRRPGDPALVKDAGSG